VLIIDIVSAFGAVAGLPWLIEVTEATARYVILRLQLARCGSAFRRSGRRCLPKMWGPCEERRQRLPRPLRAIVITGLARLFVLIGSTGIAVGEPRTYVDRDRRFRLKRPYGAVVWWNRRSTIRGKPSAPVSRFLVTHHRRPRSRST
jgi:hypothetical protein